MMSEPEAPISKRTVFGSIFTSTLPVEPSTNLTLIVSKKPPLHTSNEQKHPRFFPVSQSKISMKQIAGWKKTDDVSNSIGSSSSIRINRYDGSPDDHAPSLQQSRSLYQDFRATAFLPRIHNILVSHHTNIKQPATANRTVPLSFSASSLSDIPFPLVHSAPFFQVKTGGGVPKMRVLPLTDAVLSPPDIIPPCQLESTRNSPCTRECAFTPRDALETVKPGPFLSKQHTTDNFHQNNGYNILLGYQAVSVDTKERRRKHTACFSAAKSRCQLPREDIYHTRDDYCG